MITQPSQKPAWHQILNNLNLTASFCETPPNRTTNEPETSDNNWIQALACFARTGFLRVLVNETPTHLELYVQIAAGSALESPNLLADALATHTHTPWTTHVAKAPFELSTTLPNIEVDADSPLRNVLVVLMKLGDLISNDSAQFSQSAIMTALSYTPTTPEKPTISAPAEEDSSQDNVLFETIGTTSSTNTGDAPNIDHVEITQHDDHLKIAIHLTLLLRPSEHTELAKALAHHLRARFDADVIPTPDLIAPPSPGPKTSIIKLEAEHSEEDQRTTEGRAELAKNFTAFFKKAQEWSLLGIDIFELVGLKHPNSTPDFVQVTPTDPIPSSASASRPVTNSPAETAATAQSADDIVFDLSSRPPNTPLLENSPTFGFTNSHDDALRRGDFTDSRLKRGDAVTPLVDLVLRHPGYSDRRIGQVLSIILSIDYHAALRLAENAPCVIAWGIAQETARNYKDVIETTGGKALLVEPDTFLER